MSGRLDPTRGEQLGFEVEDLVEDRLRAAVPAGRRSRPARSGATGLAGPRGDAPGNEDALAAVQELLGLEASARRSVGAVDIARALGRPDPTPEQVAVIEAPVEPLLVVAGAGSGKTETMAARVVWLVANGFAEPDDVLGLTFTRKAAGELAERIRSRLRALHRRGLVEVEPAPVTVSTYHAYAAGIVRDHGLRLGVEPAVRLLSEAGAWQLAAEVVDRWDGDMSDVESVASSVTEAVLALAGECAEHLVAPRDVEQAIEEILERAAGLPDAPGDGAPGRPRGDVRDRVARLAAQRRIVPLVEAYVRAKRDQELLDFGDQVALAARLAREVPEVGEGERARFRVVLLDEYQDTSHAQLVLLRGLFGAGHPVVAVGDPHQSIYGWRGASAGNLQRFPRDFPTADGRQAPVRLLSTSWRNDRAVLAAANRVSHALRTPAPWADPDVVVPVPPLAARPDAGPGAVRVDWLATLEDEARAVAEVVAWEWRRPERERAAQRPTAAVLCRTRAQFPLVEAALRAAGLPVEVVGLGGLLAVPEVADVRAALEVLHDPTRGDSLMRLLTGPAWRLGPGDLEALGVWSGQLLRRAGGGTGRGTGRGGPEAAADPVEERSIVEALDDLPPAGWQGPAGQELSPAARLRLERLAALLRDLRGRTGLSLPDLVLDVERALLLDVEVAARPGVRPGAARAHLDAFVDVAAAFAAHSAQQPGGHGDGQHGSGVATSGPASAGLGGFLSWLAAADQRERGLDAPVTEVRQDAVQVLTVHAAKGLEWDVVAVTGLVEGTFPAGRNGRPPSLSNGWLGELGAVPYPLRGDAPGLPRWAVESARTQHELEEALQEFREHCGAHEVAEERRLAYVATTRARRRLLLTGAVWGDGVTPRHPSRFLLEVSELAAAGEDGSPGVPGVVVGDWVGESEGAANPREALTPSAVWPVDPLGDRRPQVEAAAALVRAARAGEEAGEEAGGGVGTRAGAEDGEEAGEEVGGGVGTRAGAEDGEEADPQAGGVDPWAREVALLLAERDAVARRDIDVPLPAHLSASRVVALASDPVALAARLRRPMPEAPSPQARQGSAFHAWLEHRFGAAALVDIDELPGAADDAAGDGALAELQRSFLASEWADRSPEAVEVAVETPVGDLVVRGRIDAVFRSDGPGTGDRDGNRGPDARPLPRWDVVDWKTGPPPRSERDAFARAVQLAVYRLAWARLQQVPVERVGAAFFYAATGETVRPVDLLDADGLAGLVTAATSASATAVTGSGTHVREEEPDERDLDQDGR